MRAIIISREIVFSHPPVMIISPECCSGQSGQLFLATTVDLPDPLPLPAPGMSGSILFITGL